MTNKKIQQRVKNEEYLNERVAIILHRPESEKKEFRTVSVNGVNYQIAYGKEVMVPRYVKEVIDESEKNEELAKNNADFMAEAFASGKALIEG